MGEGEMGKREPYKQKILFGDFIEKQREKKIMEKATPKSKIEAYSDKHKKEDWDKRRDEKVRKKLSSKIEGNYVNHSETEKEQVEILWGPKEIPAGKLDKNSEYNEYDLISYGENKKWYINKEEVSEAVAMMSIGREYNFFRENDPIFREITEEREKKKNIKL